MRRLFYILFVGNVLLVTYVFFRDGFIENWLKSIASIPFGLRWLPAENVPLPEKPEIGQEKQVKAATQSANIDQAQRNISVTSTDLEPKVSTLCFRMGPFYEIYDAESVMGELSAIGINSEPKQVEEKINDDYWVFIPPQPNKAQAIHLSRRLASAGVLDNFVISTGSNKNAISLGIFSSKDLAVSRRLSILEKGYTPVIASLPQNRSNYWLDILIEQLTAGEASFVLKSKTLNTPAVQIHKKNCS